MESFSDTSPHRLLSHWASSRPNEKAILNPHINLTWADIDRLCWQRSAKLSHLGAKSGDILIIVGKNEHRSVELFLAASRLGMSVCFCADSPTTILNNKFKTLKTEGKSLWFAHFQNVEMPTRSAKKLNVDFLFQDDIQAVQSQVGHVPSEVATIGTFTFTSGSMGTPKAVAHSNANHFASAAGLLKQFKFSLGDTWLLSLPLFHVSGLSIIYRWLWSGATLKLGTGDLRADVQDTTHASLVPVQLARLLSDSHHSLTLKRVLLGGSHIPIELAGQAISKGIDTWLGYGMTEMASTVTAKSVDETAGVGLVLPNRQLKVVDRRIFVRGETLALGYYRQGELRNLCDKDGWFDTQDLGAMDNGELKVLGRADNLFISGGENIHCEEVETVLNSHPSILSSLIIPVVDKTYGARPLALVDCSEELFTKQDIEVHLAQHLEKYKWPIDYMTLPKDLLNSGIKLSRATAKQWLSEHQNNYLVMS